MGAFLNDPNRNSNAEDIDKVISQYGLLLKKRGRIFPFSKLKIYNRN
jgi:hypothetical protein